MQAPTRIALRFLSIAASLALVGLVGGDASASLARPAGSHVLLIRGTAGHDVIAIGSAGPRSATYRLDGRVVTARGVSALVVDAGAGNDRIVVRSLPAGVPLAVRGGTGDDSLVVRATRNAPGMRVRFDGGGQASRSGDRLVVAPGGAQLVRSVYLPRTTGNNGIVSVWFGAGRPDVVRYSNIEPISIGGTTADLELDVPTGDGDNHAILRDDATAANDISEFASLNGTFETTDFRDPGTSLTIGPSDDSDTETLTLGTPDADFTATTTAGLGPGTDRYITSGSNPGGGNVTISEGGNCSGGDTLDLSPLAGAAQIDLSSTSAQPVEGSLFLTLDNASGIENLVGTAFGDSLTGNDCANYIRGLGLPDTISGGGGNDRINGGAGSDTIHGNLGNDRLYGSSGDDNITGDAGTDVMGGSTGSDTLKGVDGAPGDHLNGGKGSDTCSGDPGDVLRSC